MEAKGEKGGVGEFPIQIYTDVHRYTLSYQVKNVVLRDISIFFIYKKHTWIDITRRIECNEESILNL